MRRVTRTLLNHVSPNADYDLAINLVSTSEITRLNEDFLQHHGPTDVITFDYSEVRSLKIQNSLKFASPPLHGEIVICVDVAITQARQFRSTWQSEILRYIIHGILHLQGFDDHRPQDRLKMKREESRLLRLMERQYDVPKLEKSGARTLVRSRPQIGP